MLGKAGHSALEGGEVTDDAINMEVNEGLLAFGAQEEVAVLVVVHEEVLGEDGGAGGVAEEVEVGFLVGVGVGVVGAETVAGEVDPGGGVEGGGEGIGPGVATGGVGAPAAGGEPAVATAGGVAVDGDEEDTVYAQLAAPLVHAAAALRQGDVRFLRHQEGGVQAPGREGGDDAAGKKPVLAPFTSFPFIIHRHHQISTSIRPSRPLRRPGLFIGPCQEDTLRPVSFSADCPFG